MPFLSPAKLLVVVVVALVVLGPDKLPTAAHHVGSLWSDLRALRARLDADVRGSFPDLPSTERVRQAVRAPLTLLDDLADAHAGDGRPVAPVVPRPPDHGGPTAPDAGTGDGEPALAGDVVPPADILAVAAQLGALHRAGPDAPGSPGASGASTESGALHRVRTDAVVVTDAASLN